MAIMPENEAAFVCLFVRIESRRLQKDAFVNDKLFPKEIKIIASVRTCNYSIYISSSSQIWENIDISEKIYDI